MDLCDGKGERLQVSQCSSNRQCGKAKEKAEVDQMSHSGISELSCLDYA
jgi:hypothetical protein